MAARETLEAEPDAARHAEALDGFVGVIGTGRMEAAITGKEKGQVSLIETQREERGFYCGRCGDGVAAPGRWSEGAHGFSNRRSKSVVKAECCALATMLFG